MSRISIRPIIGVRLAPVTNVARAVAEALPYGGLVQVDARGLPVIIVPYIPLQVSRITLTHTNPPKTND